MPIKQVMCNVCQKLVNKAVTYSTGKDERACKSHPGVTEKRGELELMRFQKTRAVIKAQKRSEARAERPGGNSAWSPPSLTPKCWLCMNEGLRSDDFFTRVLIEREKMKLIHGDFNPLDMSHPGNQIKVGRCIFVLAKEKVASAMKFVREDFESLVQMSGVLAICGQCCGTLKIDPLPKPELNDLLKYAEIATIVQPVLSEIAHAELNKK